MPLNGPALGHLQILLVEDSAEDAELICDMLEQAGVAASFQRVDDEDGLREAGHVADAAEVLLELVERVGHQSGGGGRLLAVAALVLVGGSGEGWV